MTKPLLAIDIDDVVAGFCPAFCNYVTENWGVKVVPEEYTEDWGSWFGFDAEEWAKRGDEFFANEDFYASLDVVDGAWEALTELKRQYDIVAVTSRRASAKDTTRRWLDKNLDGIVDEVYFSGAYDNLHAGSHKITKGNICSELGVAYLIDDQPKHCVGVNEVGVGAVLFGDYKWNREFEVGGRVSRALDWNEVLERLKK